MKINFDFVIRILHFFKKFLVYFFIFFICFVFCFNFVLGFDNSSLISYEIDEIDVLNKNLTLSYNIYNLSNLSNLSLDIGFFKKVKWEILIKNKNLDIVFEQTGFSKNPRSKLWNFKNFNDNLVDFGIYNILISANNSLLNNNIFLNLTSYQNNFTNSSNLLNNNSHVNNSYINQSNFVCNLSNYYDKEQLDNLFLKINDLNFSWKNLKDIPYDLKNGDNDTIYNDSKILNKINFLEEKFLEENLGVNIFLKKGWSEFYLPSHILVGTNFTKGLDLNNNFSVLNVLESISEKFSYLSYFDGNSWRVFVPNSSFSNSFLVFPTKENSPNFVFSIYMKENANLKINVLE